MSTRVALLVHPDCFEHFYGHVLGLDRAGYVHEYRNDFVWNYTEALREHDVEVVTYVAALDERGRDTADDGFSVRFLPLHSAWRAGRRAAALSRTPLERYALEALNGICLLPALQDGLREDEIDVLYHQEYWSGRFDWLVRRVDRPVVAGEHGGSEGRHVHLGKGRSLQRAAAITVQSTREQRRLNQRYGVDSQLVTNGVDTGFFTPGDRARERTVLMVARLDDGQKRISDVIAAVAALGDPWRLRIAGVGPDEAALRDMARRCGVENRVAFLGWIGERERLRELYRTCGVFAMPSTWEAVTLAVLEAMACAAPVVVTPLRPFADLIEDGGNGLFVPMHAPEALAAAFARAYAQRDTLGRAGRETVATRYDRRETMSRLASILHGASAGRAVN